MRAHCLLTCAVALALSACATTGGASPSASEAPLVGEIKCAFAGASFGTTRVAGPKINMTQRSDGSWGGTIEDQAIDADYKDGKLSGGPNLKLVFKKEGDKLTITGQFKNRILRYEVSDTLLTLRTDTRSLDYPRTAPGAYGYSGEVRFLGEAEKLPATPAFAFTVMGAFL